MSLPHFQCTPLCLPLPTSQPRPAGSVEPPTALGHPQSSSPFAFASKTYTLQFKEASVLLGSVPAPRAWTLAVHISCAHVCKVVWPQTGGWRWKALGKVPVPALTTILFPYLLPAAPWEALAAGLGGVLEFTSSHLTKAQTEALAGEVTWSRSHSKLEMGVEQELQLAVCQLIFQERKLSPSILGDI